MTTTTPAYSISYDRISKDYACMVDGNCIGYAPNYADGETKCRAHIASVVEHDARLEPVAHPLVWAAGIPRCCGGQGCVACGYEAGSADNVAPLASYSPDELLAWAGSGSDDDIPF